MRDSYADTLRDYSIDTLRACYRYQADALSELTGGDHGFIAYRLGLVRSEIERRERTPDPMDALDRRTSSFDIDRIKASFRIADVVALMGSVQLMKEGNRLKGHCPFYTHPGDDSTPSLMVYPDSNSCWCFGCRQGGSVLDVAMLLVPRYSFREACVSLIEGMGGCTKDYQRTVDPQSRQGRVRVA